MLRISWACRIPLSSTNFVLSEQGLYNGYCLISPCSDNTKGFAIQKDCGA
ncbi:Uncharacterised protein [Rikenella microfusus]|uniref:Uncharacterized protein n=1 Tax=Rikenella microfusus TaxID=28139 RepID=A0A379MR33_9BACT|nr:Uncharacterised protein [Rikenella microfusus]